MKKTLALALALSLMSGTVFAQAQRITGVSATSVAAAIQTQSGCNTAGYVWVPASNTCVASGGAPGGTNGQIQYNNSGAFGGLTALSLDDSGPQIVNASDTTKQLKFDMTGEPTSTLQVVKPPYVPTVVYSAGTAYTVTNSLAAVTFGTTSPTVTIGRPGTYLIRGRAQLDFVAATFAANRTLTAEFYRTNNTPGALTNSVRTLTTPIITTQTNTWMMA